PSRLSPMLHPPHAPPYQLSLHDALPISPHLSGEDIKTARAINEEMIAGLEHLNPTAFTALNQKFHAALYKRCHNSRLLDLVEGEDRKSTRLNSSHVSISYAVFCLKKKNV